MTAKQVFEKMVLGEIEPEKALSIFNQYALENNVDILVKGTIRKLTPIEASRDMMFYSGIKDKLISEAEQNVRPLKTYSIVLKGYIKKAQDMIAKRAEASNDLTQNDAETSTESEGILITPEQAVAFEKEALGQLLLLQKIKFQPETKKHIKDKEITIPEEYRINTSVRDVVTALTFLKEKGVIHITDIALFMKTHLKSKKGKDISSSFRTAKSVKKHKNP